MGLPHAKLYATNVGYDDGKICLSAWAPERRDGEYYMPHNTPIGLDMKIPNILNLTPDDGPVLVKVVPSETETGLWVACFNDYFGDEQHLFNYKPEFKIKDGVKTDRINWGDHLDNDEVDDWELHISMKDIKMVSGDGPIAVTIVKTEKDETLSDSSRVSRQLRGRRCSLQHYVQLAYEFLRASWNKIQNKSRSK